jgi:outer membrane receptor protein involved in Fe transport
MQHHQPFRLKALSVMLASAFSMPAFAEEAAQDKSTPAPVKATKIEVISTTPLPSLGLPLEQIPATVQVVKGEEMQKQNSLSIADYMTNNMPGVTVNDTQNNPYQPDISFRGFSASPLLGTPQGLSVFYDGVRLNEPFGDVVNWDLIPINALAGMQLIPGSNPVFGLNTLGGALSLQTKSGRTHQGGALEAYAGSWGRKAASAEYGGVSKDGSVDYFFSANSFTEDGWRDYSPTDVRQLFGKVGWQNESTKINLSYTGADNDLIGNGLTPQRFLRTLGRDSIQTRPDQTINRMSLLNLTGSHWLNDETMFSGNVYYRHAKTLTLNGDGNDDIDPDDPAFNPADCVAGADEDDAEISCSGALNRTTSKRRGAGFAGQFTFNQDFLGRKNQFIAGGGFDYGRTDFTQNTEFGTVNATRGINGIGVFGDEGNVKLRGVNMTWSLFATNTHSFNERWHLTTSARYNHTTIDNKDGLVPVGDPATLTAEHSYNRINPAIGLNFTPSKALTVYGTYNEASRAPTSIELGCANPAQPCKLPNAFAGDPPLEQVVSKTYEGGLRGQFDNGVRWTTAAYVTNNYDDILFAAAPGVAGQGYFKNYGQTRRKGLEASLLGNMERFTWSVGYSLVDARYRSSESIASEVNSAAIDTDGDGEGDTLRIRSGDRIPGIPMHQLKMRGVFTVTPKWTVGANIIAFTDQYARGNENNAHRPDNVDFFGDGKVSGYAVVNLDTRYHLGNGWQIFAKAVNIFDREYNNAGLLGASLFNANGTFNGDEDAGRQALYAPGAPRAGWIGVRWEFGGAKSSGIETN